MIGPVLALLQEEAVSGGPATLVGGLVVGTGIVDEQHYAQLASSLRAGDGFAWGPGQPTSLRPPLYPALLAAVWTVAGDGNLQAVRFVQILLALATTGLVFLLGRRVFGAACSCAWTS